MLDPASLAVRTGPEADAPRLELGKDFMADLDWATIGRLPNGSLGESQLVYADYRHALLRIDSIVLTRAGQVELRQGAPHVATPMPPVLSDGDRRLANVFLPGRIAKLEPQHLFPILETAYPEAPKPSPSLAERLLPKTLEKLRTGHPLRILAWGDSVTVGSYVPDAEHNRWQAQFVARLQSQFPQARIELVTEAWGGHSTASYLAEPPGSPHNYQATVLGAKPDLIVSEFVNDAGLTPEQVEDRYGKFLIDFTALGAEWIILTPHYVRPDWMGLAAQRDIDSDPRPYVHALRQFAAKHGVALADASLRWGRLWRQGIPYNTLHMNTINHPNAAGMKLYADSLMVLFP
jgi:lysophospholipase L1-like esterase